MLPSFYDAKEELYGYHLSLIMFSVPHLVVLFVVVLVFFGPHKLPELARGLGKLMAEFRKASNDFKMAFEEEMRNIERQNREAEWKKAQETAEASRQAELPPSETSGEPKILPAHTTTAESNEPIAPVVSPVNEAVPRDSLASEASGSIEQAREPSAQDSSPDSNADPASHQPHDQRQPA